MSYQILRQPTKSNQIGTRIDKLEKKNGDQSSIRELIYSKVSL